MDVAFSNPDFWESRYQDNTARWDIGQPAAAFVTLMKSSDRPTPGRLVALGAGRGHDALWFAEHGFDVVGIDFAPSAIAASQAAAAQRQVAAQFLQADIFDLPDSLTHQFDYVLEHTCFCAIDPAQRTAYVDVVRQLLNPGGEFIGLFWAHRNPGGPPFGSSPEEIRSLFSPYFEVRSLTPVAESVPKRQGEEYLARFSVKA
jgi:SAM-dependent methyltransferase